MDVVLRSALVFLLLWFVIRVVGKREISQLSSFELILIVTLGDLVAQTMLQEDYSVVAGVLAVSTFALLSVLLSYLSWKFPRTRPLLEGRPTVVVRGGSVDDEVLRAERLPMDELLQAAREHGVRDLGDVDLAVLENDGTFSFFQRRQGGGDEEGQTSPRERPVS